MLKYRIKRFFKSGYEKIKITLAFPVFWVAVTILVCMFISLKISFCYEKLGEDYLASIFSNVFAGLITGFTLTLLSGTKSVYVARLEGKLLWLDETHKMILLHINKKHKLLRSIVKASDDDFFDIAYDTSGAANHVNERIMQSTFDKVKWFDPSNYFKKKYNYDCIHMCSVLSDLRGIIHDDGEDRAKRKLVVAEIETATKVMHTLNHDIIRDIDSLKIRIAASKKSII